MTILNPSCIARLCIALLLAALAGCDGPDDKRPQETIDLLAQPFESFDLAGRDLSGLVCADSTLNLLEMTSATAGFRETAAGDTLRGVREKPETGWRILMPGVREAFAETLSFYYRGGTEGFLRVAGPPMQEARIEIDAGGLWQRCAVYLPDYLGPGEWPQSVMIHAPTGEDSEIALTRPRLTVGGSAAVTFSVIGEGRHRVLGLQADSGALWRVTVPPAGRLTFGYGIGEGVWKRDGDGSQFRVEIAEGGEAPRLLWSDYLNPKANPTHRRWRHANLDLSDFAGRQVELRLSAAASAAPSPPFVRQSDSRHDAPCFAAPVIHNSGDSRCNILLILVDTLRRDGLGVYGNLRPVSPALDELARESTVFEAAYAPAPWTLPSTASLLSGLLPQDHGVGIGRQAGSRLRPDVRMLAERIKDAGYRTAAVSNNPIVSPDEGFAAGFDFFDMSSFAEHLVYGAERVTASALDWLGGRNEAPFFLYLHYFDPHDRYQAPLPFTRQFIPPRQDAVVTDDMVRLGVVNTLRDRLADEDSMRDYHPPRPTIDHMQRLYDGEIRYTDHCLDILFAELKERGLWENTVIMVTSDHGEEFMEHGFLKHGHTLYDEVIGVPLVMRLPDGRGAGQRIETPVSLVDIAPTALSLAGIEADETLPGLDLRTCLDGNDREESPRPVFAVSYGNRENRIGRFGPKQAVIEWPWKYVFTEEMDWTELYNLQDDPGETHDVSQQHPEVIARLEEMVRLVFSEQDFGMEAPSAEMVEKLKALGYVH